MSRAYADLLADMLAHARDAITCVQGLTPDQVAADRIRRLALERCFEVIGEAAGKVPPEIRARHPGLPWAEMVAVRNRIAHAYFAIDIAILDETARHRLPALVPLIEAALADVVASEGG